MPDGDRLRGSGDIYSQGEHIRVSTEALNRILINVSILPYDKVLGPHIRFGSVIIDSIGMKGVLS